MLENLSSCDVYTTHEHFLPTHFRFNNAEYFNKEKIHTLSFHGNKFSFQQNLDLPMRHI